MSEPVAREKAAAFEPPLIAFVGMMVLATVLRFWNLHALPLIPDEVWEVTHHSASLVEQVYRVEGFPPLHGWSLGTLMALTESDATPRVFSAVLGVATVAATAWVGRLTGGSLLAGWSCFFMAVSPYHIAVSRSGRQYSLYVFLAAITIGAALRLREKSRTGDWIVFGVSAWATMATSYLGGLLVGMLAGLLGIFHATHATRQYLLTIFCLAVACLPLAACFWIDITGTEEDFFHRVAFDKEAYAHTYYELLTGAAVGPSVDELSDLPRHEGLRAIAPWALATFLPAGVLAIGAVRRLEWRSLVGLLTLVVGAPITLAGFSFFMPTGYGIRYIAWLIVPGLVLLAGGAACSLRRPVASLATAALLAINLLGVYNRSHEPRYITYDFRRVATVLDAEFADAPILCGPPYLYAAVRYHFGSEGRPVIDAFGSTLLGADDERQRWLQGLNALEAAFEKAAACQLVIQATSPDDARRQTHDRYLTLLKAERVARPSPRVLVYRVQREAVGRAIATLSEGADDASLD